MDQFVTFRKRAYTVLQYQPASWSIPYHVVSHLLRNLQGHRAYLATKLRKNLELTGALFLDILTIFLALRCSTPNQFSVILTVWRHLWIETATFTRDRICSDLFGIKSTMVRIHSVYMGPVRNWNGTAPYGITFKSGPILYQTADPIRTGSTRSRVNTRLIRTNFVPVPDGSGPL